MDAKAQLLAYAAKHNDRKVYTDEQWCGKLAVEGVRLDQDTVAQGRREGKTIIVTETTTKRGYDFERQCYAETKTTVEVMRINL